MDHGHIIFNGDVEEAIALYLGHDSHEYSNRIIVNPNMRDQMWSNPPITIEEIMSDSSDGILTIGSQMKFRIHIQNHQETERAVFLRIMVKTTDGTAITMASTARKIHVPSKSDSIIKVQLDTSKLTPGVYSLSFVLYEVGEYGAARNIDVLRDIYSFSILSTPDFNHGMTWNAQWWGHMTIGDLAVL